MVQLSREEERILSGEFGEGPALAMEVVVKVAEVLEAPRLVKVSSAHVSGVSYRNLGEEGVKFVEGLAKGGARFSVLTTVNPAGFDTRLFKVMGVSEEEYKLQMRLLNALSAMGAKLTLSCTPYLMSPPTPGEHLAWAESSAVLYANCVIGARTNREGGPMSVFEAVVGRAPYVGLHTSEGRSPTVTVDVGQVRELVERRGLFSALGYLLGHTVQAGVPLLYNPPPSISLPSNLHTFLAAVGASSSVGLVLIEGVSPEFRRTSELEGIVLEEHDLHEVLEAWTGSDFDAVVLGCPHLSPNELWEIASRVKGRLRRRLLLFTSRWSMERAWEAVKLLRGFGVEVYADTCMVVGKLSSMGVLQCATDSAKAAYYLSNQGYEVVLASREALLESAVE